MNGPEELGDCYLEVTHFDSEATKKRSDNHARDTVVIAELVARRQVLFTTPPSNSGMK